MNAENETLIELLKEEDFNDFSLFEKVINKLISSGDRSAFRAILNKLQFSFLANGEGYRARMLEKLSMKLKDLTVEEVISIASDSLVGNYLAICWISKKEPILNEKSAPDYIQIVGALKHLEDVCSFGFPFSDQVILQLNDSLENLDCDQLRTLSLIAKIFFQLDLIQKSRSMVESFQHIFCATNIPEDCLRSNLITALLSKEYKVISFILTKFGGPDLTDGNDVISKYLDVWKCLEKLFLPIYYSSDNLRFNGVLFNDNFYFLKYLGPDGIEHVLFPFDQINLKNVRSIYDPSLEAYYTPSETFGRLKLDRIFSFKEVEKIQTASIEAITAVKSMSEDEIDDRIRKLLDDPNRCHHSPVEITDIFTQYLYVNNSNDLRWAGIISKGRSFGNVTSQQVTHQVVKACFSPLEIIILVYVNKIQHEALSEFVKLCEFHTKNYCIIDEKNLAKLFTAYQLL